jgi:hypothetical protein
MHETFAAIKAEDCEPEPVKAACLSEPSQPFRIHSAPMQGLMTGVKHQS